MNSYVQDIEALDAQFEAHKVKHFTGKEICNGWDIPDELIFNIVPTVRVLNSLRDWYGKPFYINSTYRSPDYNSAVGGKKSSLHLSFNAIDFTIKDKDDLTTLFEKLSGWDTMTGFFPFLPKSRGNFGMELYEGKFIHLDTRSTLGRKSPARWRG